jgi:hypothetical protein
MKMNELLAHYHAFCERVGDVAGLDVSVEEREPTSPEAVDGFAARYGLSVPADARAFWEGCRYDLSGDPASPHADADFFAVGFDFYDLTTMERDLPDARKLADGYAPGELMNRLLARGLPLNFSEPQLFLDLGGGGAVYLVVYDGGTPEFPVADSFAEFFAHYLAAGCFRSHDYAAYHRLVGDALPPLGIPPGENRWLNFYDRVYGTRFSDLIGVTPPG